MAVVTWWILIISMVSVTCYIDLLEIKFVRLSSMHPCQIVLCGVVGVKYHVIHEVIRTGVSSKTK